MFVTNYYQNNVAFAIRYLYGHENMSSLLLLLLLLEQKQDRFWATLVNQKSAIFSP